MYLVDYFLKRREIVIIVPFSRLHANTIVFRQVYSYTNDVLWKIWLRVEDNDQVYKYKGRKKRACGKPR